MRDEGRMETEDIILGKAKYEDWKSIVTEYTKHKKKCV